MCGSEPSEVSIRLNLDWTGSWLWWILLGFDCIRTANRFKSL